MRHYQRHLTNHIERFVAHKLKIIVSMKLMQKYNPSAKRRVDFLRAPDEPFGATDVFCVKALAAATGCWSKALSLDVIILAFVPALYSLQGLICAANPHGAGYKICIKASGRERKLSSFKEQQHLSKLP